MGHFFMRSPAKGNLSQKAREIADEEEPEKARYQAKGNGFVYSIKGSLSYEKARRERCDKCDQKIYVNPPQLENGDDQKRSERRTD